MYKREESEKAVQSVLALVGEGVETLWPSLASSTLRLNPTSHTYLITPSIPSTPMVPSSHHRTAFWPGQVIGIWVTVVTVRA